MLNRGNFLELANYLYKYQKYKKLFNLGNDNDNIILTKEHQSLIRHFLEYKKQFPFKKISSRNFFGNSLSQKN